MNNEQSIIMYKRIFDICINTFSEVKFNRIYNFSKEVVNEHKKEVRRREYELVDAYFNLQEAKGILLSIKK